MKMFAGIVIAVNLILIVSHILNNSTQGVVLSALAIAAMVGALICFKLSEGK